MKFKNILYELKKGDTVIFRPVNKIKTIKNEYIYPTNIETLQVKNIIIINENKNEKLYAAIFINPLNKLKKYWIFTDSFRNYNICKYDDIGLYDDLEFEITKVNNLCHEKKQVLGKLKNYIGELLYESY